MQTFFFVSFKWIPIFQMTTSATDHYTATILLSCATIHFEITNLLFAYYPYYHYHHYQHTIFAFVSLSSKRPQEDQERKTHFMKCVVLLFAATLFTSLLVSHDIIICPLPSHSYSCNLTQWSSSSSLMHLIILHIYLHNIIIYLPLPPPQFLYPFLLYIVVHAQFHSSKDPIESNWWCLLLVILFK